MVVIEDLFIYPLKSAQGITLPRVELVPTGFAWDRQWLVVDSSGKFLTQRTHPQLARIETRLTTEALVLRTPDLAELRVSFQHSRRTLSIQVWRDNCSGFDEGEEAAQWLSRAVGEHARLVRMDYSIPRVADRKYAGSYPVPVAFSDGYPLLICNHASLDSLNRRMPEPVPMGRFRPNIVLGGLPEFAEDGIESLHLGEITLKLVKPCTRCVITSTDQKSGERTTNPLPVLRGFRFDRQLKGVKFGENAVIASGVGKSIERGGECRVQLDVAL